MLNIMEIVVCDSSEVLSAIRLVKILMQVLTIVVPILLVVSLMISVTVALVKDDNEILATLKSKVPKRLAAALVVFFVPTIINIFMGMMGTRNEYSTCYNNANDTYIAARKAQEEVDRELKRQEEQQKYQSLQQNSNAGGNPSGGTVTTPTTNVPSGGNSTTPSGSVSFGGYTYTPDQLPYNALVDGSLVTLTFNYSVPITYEGSPVGSSAINSKIKDNLNAILTNVANYAKANSSITNGEVRYAGIYNPRSIASGATASYHAFAQAIDLYSDWTYTKNGTTYLPYSGIGNDTWNRYKKFICEVCNGVENCQYNINYKIFHNYFKGHGWCWGGNWGPASFDPMHYEYKGDESKCYTSNKKAITC